MVNTALLSFKALEVLGVTYLVILTSILVVKMIPK